MNNERASVRDLGGMRGISAAGPAYAPSQGSFLGFERAAPPTMTRPVVAGPSIPYAQPGQGSFAFSPMQMANGAPSMMSRLGAFGRSLLSPGAAIATAVAPVAYDEAQRIAAEPRRVRAPMRWLPPRQVVDNSATLSPETLARLDAAYAVPTMFSDRYPVGATPTDPRLIRQPARAVMPSAAVMGHTPQQHAAMQPPSEINRLAGGYFGQPLPTDYGKTAEGANFTAAYPATLPTMATMPSYDTSGEAEAAAYMVSQSGATAALPQTPLQVEPALPMALPQEQRPDVNGWRWNPATYSYYRISDDPMPY